MKQEKARQISLCEDKVQHNGQSVRIKQENRTNLGFSDSKNIPC